MEISTRPLTQASVKTSWVSAIFRVFAVFLKVTHLMASAVKIKFPTLVLQQLFKVAGIHGHEYIHKAKFRYGCCF